jgi:hypothetical protein
MTGTAIVLARDALSHTWCPSLVAWWTGNGFTQWHIAVGTRTRCGREIPTDRSSRLTRRHHPAADVCTACLQPSTGGNDV